MSQIDDRYQKLLDAAFYFISFRPRSEKEIHEFLQKKSKKFGQSTESMFQRVLDRLRELGYVDDEKFVRWWIDQRQSYRPKGIRFIVAELRGKGIAQDVIDAVITQKSDYSELDGARSIVNKKMKQWKALPAPEQKKKIYEHLARRGFASELIRHIIDEVVYGRVQ